MNTPPNSTGPEVGKPPARMGCGGCFSVVAGVGLVVVGIPLLILPGPGIGAIAAGLGLIAVGLGVSPKTKR
ncbi:MAG: hypothetical protein HGA39_06065 [Coriobacteriia bacterium]|nr:hypothetical protein [Coriobacteriia bacterium]